MLQTAHQNSCVAHQSFVGGQFHDVSEAEQNALSGVVMMAIERVTLSALHFSKRDSDISLLFCPDHASEALWGTNLGCMVALPVGRCYCLPENPNKLWLHVAGHCPVVKSADCAAKGRRISSLYLTALILPSTTITVILPCAQCLPRPEQSHPQTYPGRWRTSSIPHDVGIHNVYHPDENK